MHDFNFTELRQAFVNQDVILLDNLATELLDFLSLSSYLESNLYYHPLGFVYSRLYEFENKESIRIHIWDKDYYDQIPDMDIHNHYYVVNSFLFRGCLKNNIYAINEDYGTEYSIYEGGYNKNEDRVLKKSLRTIKLLLENTDIHCKKQLYQIPHQTIHSGHPLNDDMVCTIVFTETPGDPQPLVVGSLTGELEYFFPTKRVDNKIVAEILSKLCLNKN